MVKKMVTTTRALAEIIGPYGDKRISGTSDDVLEVLITMTYNFDGFSISATDVPARLDQETGSTCAGRSHFVSMTRRTKSLKRFGGNARLSQEKRNARHYSPSS